MTIIVYSFLFVLLVFLLIKFKYNRVFYFLLFIYLILFAGFRYGVGTDYFTYKRSFETGFYWYDEFGFIKLVEMLRLIGFDSQGVFFIIALLIQVMMFKGIKKLSDNYTVFVYSIFFYIVFYYFNDSLNILRQFLAMSIFVLGFNNVVQRNLVKFTIYTLIASLFHNSVILFYLIYFLYPAINKFVQNNARTYILLGISFVLMHINFDNLIKQILPFISIGSYAKYMEYFDQYLKYELSLNLWIVLTMKLIICLFIVQNKKQFEISDSFKWVYGLYIVAVSLSLMLSPMLIFRRLLYYITIFEIIIFAVCTLKNLKLKIIIIIFGILYFLVNLYFGYSVPAPYQINYKII